MLERWAKIGIENATVGKNGLITRDEGHREASPGAAVSQADCGCGVRGDRGEGCGGVAVGPHREEQPRCSLVLGLHFVEFHSLHLG